MSSGRGNIAFELLHRLVSLTAGLQLGPVTLVELSRALKATQRTIQRDVEILRDLGAPVEYEATGYTYKLRKSWKL